jgi:signal transduction histidine kinase
MRQRVHAVVGSLRGRLTAVAVLAATVAVVAAVIAFNVVLATILRHDVDRRLRTRAAAVATTVRVHDGRLSVPDSPDDAAVDARIWVFQGTEPVLSARAIGEVTAAVRRLVGRTDAFATVGEHGTRLYAQPIRRDGRAIGTVVAAESLAANDRTTDLAQLASVVLGGILLAGVLGVTWLVIGRALAPVTEMTRTAGDWSEHDPDRRFGVQPRPDELGELARTFDALLDRVAASLRHEQRLSAELSHELRTPLARIRAETELLQRRERSPRERAEAYEVLERSSAEMGRILETLMAAARAEADGGGRGRSDLQTTLAELALRWRAPLQQRGVTLEVAPTATEVGVDAEVVERVLGPLLDNAARHAHRRVAVDVARAGSLVRIDVRDDGPGVPAEERERVFEAGVRGTTADGHRGAGLGLPLARRLARAAGGDVALAPGAATVFVVTLPA